MFPAASNGRTSIYMPTRCRSRTPIRFSDFSACDQFSNNLQAFGTCPSCEFSCPNLNRFCLPFCACGLLLSSRSAMLMLCCLRLTIVLRYFSFTDESTPSPRRTRAPRHEKALADALPNRHHAPSATRLPRKTRPPNVDSPGASEPRRIRQIKPSSATILHTFVTSSLPKLPTSALRS